MIVAGATTADGKTRLSSSNYDVAKGLPHVYAPGKDILCAALIGSKDRYRKSDGTSQCELNPSRLVRP